MNAKLTPGLMAIALLVLTIYGPLAELRSITTADLQSRSYWLDLGAATIASFADAAISIIAIVATALGIPLLRGGGALVTTEQQSDSRNGGGPASVGASPSGRALPAHAPEGGDDVHADHAN